MTHADHFEISKVSFAKLTGCELEHYTQNVLRGDAWGTFMKLATVIEATAKRAVAIKLDINPESEGAVRMEFYTALLLCKETGLISGEAFEFANSVRNVRNNLAHNGQALDLNVEGLLSSKSFKNYKDRIEAFVSIGDSKITDGLQQHLNTLLLGCLGLISEVAKNLLSEEWIGRLQDDAAKSSSPDPTNG